MMLKFSLIQAFIVISSLILNAQDYLIAFKGTGAAATIDSVKIENLTQATDLTINGGNVLHLVNKITDIVPVDQDPYNQVLIYPNPMTDYARLEFTLPEAGMTSIAIYDFSGRALNRIKEYLNKGLHTFSVYGIKEGIYFIRIVSGNYSIGSRLVCSGSNENNVVIKHENSYQTGELIQGSKGTHAEIFMQYNEGDRLKITGYSEIYSTVIVDVPTESKDLSFEFIKCTDGDENNYPVVRIGDQIWMAENLKTSSYKNGTSIPHVENGTEWANLTAPGYCWYNNEISNKNIYGGLYNWYAVNTGNLCPADWHVPSDNEWHQMVLYLDANATLLEERESRTAADNLKETGITHWNYPNAGTDDTGFTALPGGYRRYTGEFGGTSDNGDWRTSTQYDATRVWYRYMFINSGDVYRKITNMQAGYSVRCIKD